MRREHMRPVVDGQGPHFHGTMSSTVLRNVLCATFDLLRTSLAAMAATLATVLFVKWLSCAAAVIRVEVEYLMPGSDLLT
jgi:hypothetical protein